MYIFIGIGKSTLANEMCLNWAKEEDFLHNDYELVILIQLRDLVAKSLEEMMVDLTSKETVEQLKTNLGSKCLIILEGLDEVSSEWQNCDKTFIQLVKQNVLLEEAKILITSRPHACVELYADIKQTTRRIEIIGFNKEQIKNYAQHFLYPADADNFMQQLEKCSHVYSLCYVPLSLKMTIESFQYSKQILPYTLTKLYQSFILSKFEIQRKRDRNKTPTQIGTLTEKDNEQLVSKLSKILNYGCKEVLESIFLLSKLAYHSWFDVFDNVTFDRPRIIYTYKELADCNITLNQNGDAYGFLKATHIQLFSDDVTYNFTHLSVQEYFCALYICLLPEDKQLQLIKSHLRQYPHIWPFYARLTKLNSQRVLEYLCGIMSQMYDQHDDIRMQIEETVIILHCIYEAQEADVCKQFKGSIHLNNTTLLPYSCVSISYFMSVVQATHLNLLSCKIETKMLTKYKYSMESVKVLNLTSYYPNAVDITNIMSCIGKNLTHLLFSNNRLYDEGVRILIPTLSCLPHLIELELVYVFMNTNGAILLGEFLKCNTSLQSLNISMNHIGDCGMKAIFSGLHFNIALVQLIAVGCSFCSAVSVSDMLKNNKTLKHLNISTNPIGDNGFAAIVEALCINDTLTELEVADQTMTRVSGESLLINLINTNKALKKINVSNILNSISARAALQNSVIIFGEYGANTMCIFTSQNVSKQMMDA